MTKVIVYPVEGENRLCVLYPMDGGLTLEQIALKDVPPNVPFRYIDKSLVPNNIIFFNAWEVDFSNPDGYGADHGYGSNNVVIAWNQDGTPVTEWRDEI